MNKTVHQKKLVRVAQEFRSLISEDGDHIDLKKSTDTHIYRPIEKPRQVLNVKDFTNVVSIDRKGKTALVEGMVPFDTVVRETLKFGLVPKVVPELRKLTVGGVTAGIGVEASSFRYGLFHETVTSMTILTGQGELVHATPSNAYKDLFFGFPNSYGTFGYLLNAEISLVTAKPYVQLTYLHFTDLEVYFDALKKHCKAREADYIDGAIFAKDRAVLVLGNMIDEAPFTSNYRSNGIFYKAIQQKDVDYLTMEDFLWRWDADSFWSTKGTPLQNSIIRKLIGERVLRSDAIYKLRDPWRKIQGVLWKLGTIYKEEVIQDLGIPLSKSAEFMHWFDESIGMYPVWICPVRSVRASGTYPLFTVPQEMHCDIGFYGLRKHESSGLDPFHYNRLVEKKMLELDGLKALYSRTFLDKRTFWKLYNGSAYKRLKKKYDPEGRFKNLYEKIVG